MIFDLNGTWFNLANGDLELALMGYDNSRTEILDFLLAEDAFDDQLGPFGFDLSRVDAVRKAIKAIVAPRRAPGGVRPSQINAFRRELIFVTADATRRDPVQLVLHLYMALMERHSAMILEGQLAPNKPSAAGEHLLRCLAVHAVYDNLASYRFVLEQFARVVAVLKMTEPDGYAHMCSALLAVASAPLADLEALLKAREPLAAKGSGAEASTEDTVDRNDQTSTNDPGNAGKPEVESHLEVSNRAPPRGDPAGDPTAGGPGGGTASDSTEARAELKKKWAELVPVSPVEYRRRPVIAVVCPAKLPKGFDGKKLLQCGYDLGVSLAKATSIESRVHWVILLREGADPNARAISSEVRRGATDAGGRVVWLVEGQTSGWTPGVQVLTLTDTSEVQQKIMKDWVDHSARLEDFLGPGPAELPPPKAPADSRLLGSTGAADPDDTLLGALRLFLTAPHAP